MGYAHLVSHREKCFKSMPDEVRRGIEEAAANLKSNSNLIYVCDRGFDDRKVFEKVTELDESFVIRVYKDRKFDGGRKLKELPDSIASLEQYTAKMKVRGSYCDVPIYFGYTHVSIGGAKLTLVVSHVPALKNSGKWLLLTNLPVNSPEEAKRVVGIYRKRWTVEEFFRLLKAGLGLEEFQVEKLSHIRKIIAILLGLAIFLYRVKMGESPFKELLLDLGDRLGIKSERNGPYLLIRGFIRLLNYEVTREEPLKAEGMKIVWRKSYG